MITSNPQTADAQWLFFSLMTVACWGLYGLFLHSGQISMGDPVNGRYKAFLCVGFAYFLTAVLAPLAVLLIKGANWNYPIRGFSWSLLAGVVGALGAFGVLLAFGAKGSPAVVMSIVFAGAPVINAIASLILHPPQGGLSKIPLPFLLGILLAAAGGCLVTLYKPAPSATKSPTAAVSALSESSAGKVTQK